MDEDEAEEDMQSAKNVKKCPNFRKLHTNVIIRQIQMYVNILLWLCGLVHICFEFRRETIGYIIAASLFSEHSIYIKSLSGICDTLTQTTYSTYIHL
jgi:hypothetical protein